MKHLSLAILLSTCLLFNASATPRLSGSIRPADIAVASCPIEWEHVRTRDLGVWVAAMAKDIVLPAGLHPVAGPDHGRLTAALAASASFALYFRSLEESWARTPRFHDQAQAMLDLAECLAPTDQVRARLTYAYRAVWDLDDAEIHQKLFGAFDRSACRGLWRVSREIFKLDPEADDFVENVRALVAAGINPSCI